MMPRRQYPFLLLASLYALSSMVGCLAVEDDVFIDSDSQAALTTNALTTNALTTNALDPGVFQLSIATTGDLYQTALGRLLLRYIARCAYGPDDLIEVPAYDIFPTEWYPGNLSIAEIWKTRGLDEHYQKMMSACLLAHLNIVGEPVPLSVRYIGAPPTSAEESYLYFVGDGAFYGNVYTQPQKRYACTIRQRAGTSPAASSNDAAKRVCDINGNCGVTSTGYCDEVCSMIVPDGKQWLYSHCHDGQPAGNRTYYDFTLSVWLQGTDGPPCSYSELGYTCKPQ